MDIDDVNNPTGIGYLLDVEQLAGRFRAKIEEVSHLEKRFDPKTGKAIADEKVIDTEASDPWTFKGKHFDDLGEWLETVAEELNCDFCYIGNPVNNEGIAAFSMKLKGEESEYGITTVPFASLTRIERPLMTLGKKLRHLGIMAKEPVMFSLVEISN